MFKNSGNVDNFMELLKLQQRKLLKISVFSLQHLLEYQIFCDALFVCNFKISFSICFLSTSNKLKLSLCFYLFRIAIMFGWFPYLRIAFKVASLVLPKARHLRYQGSVPCW